MASITPELFKLLTVRLWPETSAEIVPWLMLPPVAEIWPLPPPRILKSGPICSVSPNPVVNELPEPSKTS